MCTDVLIHPWLRCGGFVRLIVAVAAIADQVDDDIALKFLPIIKRNLRAKDHRFWVITIDVQDRRVNHFGNIGAIEGTTRIFHFGGEADLIINHHMNGAANAIAACL